MAINATDLQNELGASSSDYDAVTRCLNVSQVLVDKYLADQELTTADIGEVMYDEAHLACAVELFHLRNAPNGVLAQQYGDPDTVAAPVRIGGDPLRATRQILAPWTIPSIG